MIKYAYQIQGALENPDMEIKGLRVLVCTVDHFYTVDVPVEVIDHETVLYLQYRFRLCEYMNIQNLPYSVQNKIRVPLGRWLDQWILERKDGSTSNRKNSNA